MSSRSSLEAIWLELRNFTEEQNRRSAAKLRSKRRSLATLLVTLCAAVILSMGGWHWLWGGWMLWMISKLLFDYERTIYSRQGQTKKSPIHEGRPVEKRGQSAGPDLEYSQARSGP
jgi:hypothetical protein